MKVSKRDFHYGYIGEIVELFFGDYNNFKSFWDGKKDTYLHIRFRPIRTSKYFDDLVDLFVTFYKKKTKEKLYFRRYSEDCILISRNPKKIEFFDKVMMFDLYYSDGMRLLGWMLGTPECCVEQYVEDYEEKICGDLEGYGSVKRYRGQLKTVKQKKDVFGVRRGKKCIHYKYFIPCHPRCKEALAQFREFSK